MLKKIFIPFCVLYVLVFAVESCTKNPFGCVVVEGIEDSVKVNVPVSLNAYCSSNANDYFWQVNLDSVYFTPRITLTFAAPGEQQIYLFVTNGKKGSGVTKKLIVHP